MPINFIVIKSKAIRFNFIVVLHSAGFYADNIPVIHLLFSNEPISLAKFATKSDVYLPRVQLMTGLHTVS